ncbi:YdcF family protein, partial [Vibrio fortis]
ITVTSQWQHWVDYYNEELPLELVLSALIADFERIKEYPRLGFQVALHVPEDVESAYQQLKSVGFEA